MTLVLLDVGQDESQSWRNYVVAQATPFPSTNPEDTAVLFYTSGTTGAPKGVPLSHRNLTANLHALLDLKLIRSDPGAVKAALERRGAGTAVDELLELDRSRRELLPQVEERRARKKRVSEQIGRAKREGAEAPAEVAESERLSAEIKSVEQIAKDTERDYFMSAEEAKEYSIVDRVIEHH